MIKDLKAVRGQEYAVKQLEKALLNNRISHAYLFVGPEGVGKRTAALAFAAALHCKSGLLKGRHCGQCPACLKFEHHNHPDAYYVEPAGHSLKIEQIREIQAVSAYKQLESKYKTIIIEEAQKMTDEAANCLLKILEEPPGEIIFILLTSNLYGVLPTIISRCQLIRFQALGTQLVEELLKIEAGVPAGEAGLLSRLAAGSVAQALKIWQNRGEDNRWRSAEKIALAIQQKDRLELLRLSAALEKDECLQATLEELLLWYRDVLVWARTGCREQIFNQQVAAGGPGAAEQAQELEASRAEEAISLINQALKRLRQNANARLTLDVLLLRLCEVPGK